MKITWTEFAVQNLNDIFEYHKEVAGKNVASKIKKDIFYTSRQLKQHPESGQIEPYLAELNEGYRYLISGNYKLTYKIIGDEALITDVFDTRQNPVTINSPKRRQKK